MGEASAVDAARTANDRLMIDDQRKYMVEKMDSFHAGQISCAERSSKHPHDAVPEDRSVAIQRLTQKP
jgi:hypothetical protein